MKLGFGWIVAFVELLGCGTSLWAANPRPGLVVAWGDNTYGQTNVPPGLTNVIAVAGGYYHTLALKSNSTVVAWGGNFSGQTNVPPGLTNVVAIAAGDFHSLALKRDQTVVAWGAGKTYHPVDGTNYGQSIVPPGLTGVKAIAAGSDFNLALKTNGTVTAWGFNLYGQTNVPAKLTNVVAIAASGYHCLALKLDGTVVAWGFGTYGETNPPSGLSNVVAIATGWNHNLALKTNGTVTAWGYNGRGQTNPPPGLNTVQAVAGGGNQRIVRNADGSVVAWGWINFTKPPAVPVDLPPADAVAAGVNHLLLLTSTPFFLTKPPAASALMAGTNIELTVALQSADSVKVQWSFNGTLISEATGTNLTLSNFGPAQAGVYTVIAASEFSAATNRTVLRLTNSPVVLVDGVDVGGGVIERVDPVLVSLSSSFGGNSLIYYTVDGSAPDFLTIPYSGAFMVTNSAVIRTVAYNPADLEKIEAAPIEVRITPTYILSMETTVGGFVSAAPPPDRAGKQYLSGTVVTLTATPTNGWSFLSWSGDRFETTNVLTMVMDRPHTLQAVFGTQLGLATLGNGSVVLDSDSRRYPYGATVQLTAVPDSGAYFFGWAGAASGFENPLRYQITKANPSLSALFGQLGVNQVSLAVLPDPNGTVRISPSKNVYTLGETVTLTAVPATNFLFRDWGGDASSSTNPLVMVLTNSTVITVAFLSGIPPTNPPVVARPPLRQTSLVDGNLIFSVEVAGDGPYTYQWRLDRLPVAGATNETLHLKELQPAQTGLYDVVVTGPAGVTTSPAVPVAILVPELILGAAQRSMELSIYGPSGSRYRLEYTTDLAVTNWLALFPLSPSSAGKKYNDDRAPDAPRRFYRLRPVE